MVEIIFNLFVDATNLQCQINNKNNENYQLHKDLEDEKLKSEEFKNIAVACYRNTLEIEKQLEETKKKMAKEQEERLKEMDSFNSTQPKPCPF